MFWRFSKLWTLATKKKGNKKDTSTKPDSIAKFLLAFLRIEFLKLNIKRWFCLAVENQKHLGFMLFRKTCPSSDFRIGIMLKNGWSPKERSEFAFELMKMSVCLRCRRAARKSFFSKQNPFSRCRKMRLAVSKSKRQ